MLFFIFIWILNSVISSDSSYNNPLVQSSSSKQNKLSPGSRAIRTIAVSHYPVCNYSVDGDRITFEIKCDKEIKTNLKQIPKDTFHYFHTQSLFMMKCYVCISIHISEIITHIR